MVVLSEREADIDLVMDYAVTRGIPLTARAAGTNLTGSAIGLGIILDVSRLNRILEVNPEEKWARVQPGIVLNELNAQLASTGLICPGFQNQSINDFLADVCKRTVLG